MRRRGLLALVVVSLVIIAAAVTGLVLDARQVSGDPEQTGRAYLAAWAAADLPAMRTWVASPPADFIEQHRRLGAELGVLSVALTPGTVVRHGDQAADLPFEGVRQIGELGQWRFSAVLHLAVRDGGWKVVWTPETLHPGVSASERLRLAQIPVPGTELLTRQGRSLPHDSGAETYFEGLVGKIDNLGGELPSGWAIEAHSAEGKVRRLIVFRRPVERTYRTTVDWWTQAAAARALDGTDRPAAIVAVRPSTGEVLAVADRLPDEGAFNRSLPTGTTLSGREPLFQGRSLGFGRSLRTGVGGTCGSVRATGRRSVRASPLCMALVAAAAQNGTWRPPRLMSRRAVTRLEGSGGPVATELPAAAVSRLRTMMTSATAGGKASSSRLPPRVWGRAGTAQAVSGGGHAWFLGYRGDLAFAVFVENGGTGADAAVPLAVRFLAAL